MRQVVAIFLVTMCAFAQAARAGPSEEVEEILRRARSERGTDAKVAFLKKALADRGRAPDNIFIEQEIAANLSALAFLSGEWLGALPQDMQDDLREALRYCDSILDNYQLENYGDVLDGEPGARGNGRNVMLHTAVNAGYIAGHRLGELERAREYELRALEMLMERAGRRREAWLALEKPEPPSDDGSSGQMSEPERVLARAEARRIYESELRKWREKRRRAEAGPVLTDREQIGLELAVRYYGESDRHQVDRLLAMDDLLERFPGTPIAAEARRERRRGVSMLMANLTSRLRSDVAAAMEAFEGQPPPEGAPEVSHAAADQVDPVPGDLRAGEAPARNAAATRAPGADVATGRASGENAAPPAGGAAAPAPTSPPAPPAAGGEGSPETAPPAPGEPPSTMWPYALAAGALAAAAPALLLLRRGNAPR